MGILAGHTLEEPYFRGRCNYEDSAVCVDRPAESSDEVADASHAPVVSALCTGAKGPSDTMKEVLDTW